METNEGLQFPEKIPTQIIALTQREVLGVTQGITDQIIQLPENLRHIGDEVWRTLSVNPKEEEMIVIQRFVPNSAPIVASYDLEGNRLAA